MATSHDKFRGKGCDTREFWPYANSQFQLFHIPNIIYNLAATSKPCTTHKFFVEISSSDIHLILLYFQYICFTCSLMNASYFRSYDQKLFHRALKNTVRVIWDWFQLRSWHLTLRILLSFTLFLRRLPLSHCWPYQPYIHGLSFPNVLILCIIPLLYESHNYNVTESW